MSLIIKKNTTFKIPRTGSGAPILWKIAIFGAGTAGADSEYVWDGVTTSDDKPVYYGQAYRIQFVFNAWAIYDSDNDQNLYISADLITWEQVQGALQVPSSALSYSQSSYIQTVVLAGGDPDQSGTYTWNGTTFVNGKPRYVGPLKSNAPTNNSIQFSGFEYILNGYYPAGEEMIDQSVSIDLATNWSEADCVTAPTVSSIIYTA